MDRRRKNAERQRRSQAQEKEQRRNLNVQKLQTYDNKSVAISDQMNRNEEGQKTSRAKYLELEKHSDAIRKKLAQSKESEEALLDRRRKNAERQRIS